MNDQFFVEEHFENRNFTNKPLLKGDYENCIFTNCSFLNSNLSGLKFIECEFLECDLSNSELNNTAFQSCDFSACKMIGLNFEKCENFGFSISAKNCILNYSSFFKMKLPKMNVSNSKLQGTDFSESILSMGNFGGCDLLNAVFQNTNLEKCDFRKAANYSIDPENNIIKGAKFSIPDVIGLLDKHKIKIE